MSLNVSYYEAPKEFMLYPSPTLHLLRSESVILNQKDLSRKEVRLIIADWRCDNVKMSFRFLGPKHEESIEIYSGFDQTYTPLPDGTPENWWATMYSWIFCKEYKSKGLSMVVLSEQFLGIEDVEGKYGTYVDFLHLEVLAVSDFSKNTGILDHLANLYNDCMRLDLQEEGKVVVWLFYDNSQVDVVRVRNKEMSVIEIKRIGKL